MEKRAQYLRSLWNLGNGWRAEYGDFSGRELLNSVKAFVESLGGGVYNISRLTRDVDGMEYWRLTLRFIRSQSFKRAPADIGFLVGNASRASELSDEIKLGERYSGDRVFLCNLLEEVKADTRFISSEDVRKWVTEIRDRFVKFLQENRQELQFVEDPREVPEPTI